MVKICTMSSVSIFLLLVNIFIGVDPWVERGTYCPYFFGGRHFCTNVHNIHWVIGAIFINIVSEFSGKFIRIVATRCQILRQKCTKFIFGWGFVPDPAGELAVLPRPPSCI